MKIAVTVAVYNEEKYIARLLDSLLNQTASPDSIIIVDDGSTDRTEEIVLEYKKRYSVIRYFYQKNAGPAAARNKAWTQADADICIFTDGDCEPNSNWIETIIKPFADKRVGAVAGAYRTINTDSILARFIGYEVDWRYRNIKGEIDAHGTYNLAVRKNVLYEVGGLNEAYPKASGEDWDMTYKISKKHKIIFLPDAIVGHHHPEDFFWYMNNQVRRGLDRVKVYQDHPEMISGDNYTPWYVKYQVLASGALPFSLILLIFPFSEYSILIPVFFFIFLVVTSLISFPFIVKKDLYAALYGIPIQIVRNFAWFLGLLKGITRLQITK